MSQLSSTLGQTARIQHLLNTIKPTTAITEVIATLQQVAKLTDTCLTNLVGNVASLSEQGQLQVDDHGTPTSSLKACEKAKANTTSSSAPASIAIRRLPKALGVTRSRLENAVAIRDYGSLLPETTNYQEAVATGQISLEELAPIVKKVVTLIETAAATDLDRAVTASVQNLTAGRSNATKPLNMLKKQLSQAEPAAIPEHGEPELATKPLTELAAKQQTQTPSGCWLKTIPNPERTEMSFLVLHGPTPVITMVNAAALVGFRNNRESLPQLTGELDSYQQKPNPDLVFAAPVRHREPKQLSELKAVGLLATALNQVAQLADSTKQEPRMPTQSLTSRPLIAAQNFLKNEGLWSENYLPSSELRLAHAAVAA